MLDNLAVVLVRTKYPENVGAAARACLNMGVSELVLVDPLRLDLDRALPLATVHARHILETARIEPDLATAVAGCHAVCGTTARLGGWRKGVATPEGCAAEVASRLAEGQKVALVFGSEDRGLSNEETQLCTALLTIPTVRENSSLNLAQAVMVVLYECFRAVQAAGHKSAAPNPACADHAEQETLFAAMKSALVTLDFFKDDNADYWMLPVRRFFSRLSLKKTEFNLLMGVCRQINWLAGRAEGKKSGEGGREGKKGE